MSRVKCLQHIHRLTGTHLADDNTVRSHAQGRLDQIAYRDAPSPLRVRALCFEAHEIAEVTGMENEQVKLNSLYKWDDADRCFKKTGELQNTMKLDRRGLSLNRGV